MGILGIESAYFLADRIFSMLDEDGDEKVNFEDFIKYLDILINGDQNEKNEWTFKLIDCKKRGFFDLPDFRALIELMCSAWILMTGNQTNDNLSKKIDKISHDLFHQIDIHKKGIVVLEDFKTSLRENPNLLEVYQILNNGITESMEVPFDQNNQKKLLKISNILDCLIIENHKNSINLSYLSKESINLVVASSFMVPTISRDSQSCIKIHENNGSQIKDVFEKNENDDSTKYLKENKLERKKNQFNPNAFHQIKSIVLDPEEDSFGRNRKKTKILTLSPKHYRKHSIKEDSEELKSDEDMNNNENGFPNLKAKRTSEKYKEGNKEKLNKFQNAKTVNLSEKKEENKNFGEIIKDCQETNDKILIKLKEIRMLAEGRDDSKKSIFYESYQKKTQEILLKQKIKKTAQNIHNKKNMDKKGIISFGNEKWNFVLNMMLGIQNAVRSVYVIDNYVLNDEDFKLSYSFEIIPRKTHFTKYLSISYQFFDFAPYTFYMMRKKNNITNEAYLNSIGVDHFVSDLIQGKVSTLSELISSGKSGCFFYYTADGKYTLKTIHKKEYTFFIKILKDYYEFLTKYSESFITKIYGLHKITYKAKDSLFTKKIHFIVMENIFNTNQEIHKKYDLKGSLYKRETDTKKEILSPQKDKNALANKLKIDLPTEINDEFKKQMELDCEFLSKHNIIDYSFLVGIHHKELVDSTASTEKYKILAAQTKSMIYDKNTLQTNKRMYESTDKSITYFFGIIDIFTKFDLKKRGEYIFKKMIFGPTISAIPPENYSQRFRDFIFELLEEK